MNTEIDAIKIADLIIITLLKENIRTLTIFNDNEKNQEIFSKLDTSQFGVIDSKQIINRIKTLAGIELVCVDEEKSGVIKITFIDKSYKLSVIAKPQDGYLTINLSDAE